MEAVNPVRRTSSDITLFLLECYCAYRNGLSFFGHPPASYKIEYRNPQASVRPGQSGQLFGPVKSAAAGKTVSDHLIYSIRYSKSTSVIKMDSDKVYTVADSDSEGDKEEDDANLPSREECETRCQTFAEVTGTDSALAMFYLQDRDWDLQRSISDYFLDQDKNAHGSTGAAKAESRMSSQVTSKKNSISTGSSSSATTSRSTTDPDCVTLG
ncbi:hypothetical protein RRG08_044145 [Elysia crispata]|uniref:Uncharacterized protein n=1 Tax=Elysia crispata TaxID=231223 RepID=A0AAE1DB56_9GAST|nr:hypothetical protein RRG08_044145 [Elysia crispata]